MAEGDLQARLPESGPDAHARLSSLINGTTESFFDGSKRRDLEEVLRESEVLPRAASKRRPRT